MYDPNNREVESIERRLAEALGDIDAQLQPAVPESIDEDLSSRDLLQMAWDRAEQEVDELRTELRIMQQRHREAERNLVARINERKRLQHRILERAGEPTQAA